MPRAFPAKLALLVFVLFGCDGEYHYKNSAQYQCARMCEESGKVVSRFEHTDASASGCNSTSARTSCECEEP